MSFQTPAVNPGRRRPATLVSVEVVREDRGTSIVATSILVTEEDSNGAIVWQRGWSVDDARAVHRALGVALSECTPVAIVRDVDCPSCGWPETYADGTVFGCRKCGWTEAMR